MRVLLIAIILCCNLLSYGQQRLFNKAHFQYENLAFSKAINLYERALQLKFDEEAAYNLANSYRLTQQYEKAEEWFGKNAAYASTQPKLALYYAQMLHMSGKYELALEWYTNYKNLNPFDKVADEGVFSVKEAVKLDDRPNIYEARSVSFNSEFSEFGPRVIKGKVYFTSNKDEGLSPIDPWSGNPYHKVYKADFSGPLEFSNVQAVSETDLNYHEGPFSMSPDNKWFANTWNYEPVTGELGRDKSISNLKIMISPVDALGAMGEAVDFPFNNSMKNVAHPCFSPDGKRLYFSADLDGGQGGADIWYSEKVNGVWGIPVNLGAMVNTSAEEMYPSFDFEGNLVFASNGHIGYGGLDLYRAIKATPTSKYTVENLGGGINSSRDDFSIVFTESGKGYMASNRAGGKGADDIYYFEATRAIVDMITYYSSDSLPAANVELTIADDRGNIIVTGNADENGSFVYPLAVDEDFTISFKTFDTEFPAQTFNTDGLVAGKNYEKIFYIGIESVESYVARGLVVEDQSKLPLKNVNITVSNLGNGNATELRSDEFGFYVDRLEPNSKYLVTATLPGYEPASFEYETEKIDADIMLPVIYMKGGARVYNLTFEHIYFDYDKSNIRESSKSELEKMLDIMKLSPELRVEISAHTDARGSNAYNMSLSDRRAASVRTWLIDNGINASRMISKGYGESKLTNKCADDVTCSEEEHQKNRRVEFAVLDEDDKAIYQSLDGKDPNN